MPPRKAQGSYKVRLSFYLNMCFAPYSIDQLKVPTSVNLKRMEYAGKRSRSTYLCIVVQLGYNFEHKNGCENRILRCRKEIDRRQY
jgi:hypothetical protein